jgi:glucosamine-6-phosphate deaminase
VQIRVVETDALDQVGADVVQGWLGRSANCTFIPALGTSALGIYRELGRRRTTGAFDASGVRLVQLDEYSGLPRGDRRSLRDWLIRDVATPLGVPDERIIGLDGHASDEERACREYDGAVAEAGGIDVAVLGLGPNGHLGFNEPPSGPDAPTRFVDLAEASIGSNARYWGSRDAVPRRAVTAGMSTILGARHVLLVLRGKTKEAILRRVLTESVSPDVPASYLRSLEHAWLLADREAWPADLAIPREGRT